MNIRTFARDRKLLWITAEIGNLEMTNADFEFYPLKWKNTLGCAHFCFLNLQNSF